MRYKQAPLAVHGKHSGKWGQRESSEPKEKVAVRWEVSWTRERE